VRPGTVTVAAEIREDDAASVSGEDGGGTMVEPLHCRGGETMEQYRRAAFAGLAVGQFQAIAAGEPLPARVCHVVASGASVEAVETAAGEDVSGGGQHLARFGGVQGSAARRSGQGEELEDVPVWAMGFRRLRPEVAAASA
jgi:hypothetical protein